MLNWRGRGSGSGSAKRGWWGQHTESKLRLSSLWRGITLTVSISQRNATSAGVRPGGRGSAMMDCITGVDFGEVERSSDFRRRVGNPKADNGGRRGKLGLAIDAVMCLSSSSDCYLLFSSFVRF